MKSDFVMPIIVLSVLCLVVSAALSIVNNLTLPVIKEAAAQREEKAKRDVIPDAEEFVLLEVENLPKTITGVYGTSNNAGFIIAVTAHGYGGDINLICGIDPQGKLIRCIVLSHTETKGLGTPVFEEPHAGQYWGKDKTGITEISAISGATITSNAYKNGIRDAFDVFEIVKGIRL